jgi:hypothetical protein
VGKEGLDSCVGLGDGGASSATAATTVTSSRPVRRIVLITDPMLRPAAIRRR